MFIEWASISGIFSIWKRPVIIILSGNTRDCILTIICDFHMQYYTEHCAACSDQTQTARVYQNADSSPSKHEDSTQCCFNVGPAPLAVGQYWNSIGSNPLVCLGSTQVSVYTHPSATIIFSPADQGTFSKTAGQSQAYYNTWNWERGGGGNMTSTICTF